MCKQTIIYEFLDKESIENVITCLNYKVDKVVFFGYEQLIKNKRKCTIELLKNVCNVEMVEFYTVSEKNLQKTLGTMHKIIEKAEGEHRFFDITGGEDLILVAFGILSKELNVPMHMFDVEQNELLELNEGEHGTLSSLLEERKILLSIENFVKMQGGIVNSYMQKDIKVIQSENQKQDIEKLYKVASARWDLWNPFCNVIKKMVGSDETLQVSKPVSFVREKLQNGISLAELNLMLDALEEKGLILNLIHQEGRYSFNFKNNMVKNIIKDVGSILELHTYLKEVQQSDECVVGVHLDWDGVIHERNRSNTNCDEIDVVNEIDVFTIKGNIPTIISCKSGRMDKAQPLNCLYELQTVADRFGGKYAKKVLVTVNELGAAYMQRASEMGIEVRVEK